MGQARNILFVLQNDWYDMSMSTDLVAILQEIVLKKWNGDEVAKSIVAYLAVSLHEGTFVEMLILYVCLIPFSLDDGSTGANTPSSAISHLAPSAKHRKKACQVLEMFPLSCGNDLPTSLNSLPIYLHLGFISFSLESIRKKFELVNGLSVLGIVLPDVWDEDALIC